MIEEELQRAIARKALSFKYELDRRRFQFLWQEQFYKLARCDESTVICDDLIDNRAQTLTELRQRIAVYRSLLPVLLFLDIIDRRELAEAVRIISRRPDLM